MITGLVWKNVQGTVHRKCTYVYHSFSPNFKNFIADCLHFGRSYIDVKDFFISAAIHLYYKTSMSVWICDFGITMWYFIISNGPSVDMNTM